jgi:hypothetical protein
MKTISIVLVLLFAVIGFLSVSVYAIRGYVEWKDSHTVYSITDHYMTVAAEDNVDRVIIDGNNSMILYRNGDTPIDIKIPGEKTPTTIRNFFAVNYYPTIMSRWNATKYALNMIWRGKKDIQ